MNNVNNVVLDDEILNTLKKARFSYGNKNQILVCMEELNELACVLAKYPRYSDERQATEELYEKVLDEYADVLIILNHVQEIFGLSNISIYNRVNAKVDRLKRWLSHSKDMQETVDDRAVSDTPCRSCEHEIIHEETDFLDYCSTCHSAQATEGIPIHYTSKE